MINKRITNQQIELITLSNMEPESGYQRETKPEQVENIVNKFDETKLGIITVSYRDGKYHIIDGAHRVKALRKLGFTHALCVVFTGLTFEQEAEYFRSQNDGTRPIRPLEFFKAGLVSGNEQCVRINKIVKANGFRIGVDNRNFNKIGAIQALFTIVCDYGFDTLDDTLCLLANTWNGIPKASQTASLLGLAEFVSHYGMRDFAERLRDKFSAVIYEYTDIIRTRVVINSITSRKKYCRILVEQYNKGLSHNNKKRLVWED